MGETGKHTFFGYYDKTPFSEDGTKILCTVVDGDDIAGNRIHKTGYYNLNDTSRFIEVGETSTVCWQQGCRLMWFPSDRNNLIMYNNFSVADGYFSVLQDINTKKILARYDYPVYDLDTDGVKALTLNFSRLQRMRPGYGYCNLTDHTKGQGAPAEDGVWLCNIDTGRKDLLISLKFLSMLNKQETMDGAEHYVNHLAFNPEGSKFLFYHFWNKNNRRYSRAIIYDIKSKDMWVLNENSYMSHYDWLSNDKVLIYSYYNNKYAYVMYDYGSKTKSVYAKDILRADGHPSFGLNKDLLLIDTYPGNITRLQNIVVFNNKKNRCRNIFRAYSPLRYNGEFRCDLHPRWDRQDSRVCTDLVGYDNKRKLAVIYRNGKEWI